MSWGFPRGSCPHGLRLLDLGRRLRELLDEDVDIVGAAMAQDVDHEDVELVHDRGREEVPVDLDGDHGIVALARPGREEALDDSAYQTGEGRDVDYARIAFFHRGGGDARRDGDLGVELVIDEVFRRVGHDLLHIVRRMRNEPGRSEGALDAILDPMLPHFLDAEAQELLGLVREGPLDEGQEPEALLEVVLADEVKVVYPFPDARDLRHDALGAEEAHEFVDGEVVAAHVYLADYEDPGYLLELLAERDRGDLDRDFPQGRHDLRDVLLGDRHQLAPAPVEHGHRRGGIGGAGPERVLHVLHVVAYREREPHVLGEVGPELGIGVVGAHRHHDDVLEAHVAEEILVEDEVLPGAAGAGRDGHEEYVELVLAVLLRGEVLEGGAQDDVTGHALLARGVGAGHLDSLAVRDGHGLRVDADAPEHRAHQLGGEVAHVGQEELDPLVAADGYLLARARIEEVELLVFLVDES